MDFLLLASLVLALLLIISGIAKLRDKDATADAFAALRLPAWLRSAGAPLALPWGELALAALLLFGRGWVLTAAAAATLVLMLAYTGVIGRALTFDEPVRCGCFGALGSGDVTRATLVRNLLLVVLAALSLAGALTDTTVWGQPASTWGWVALALISAAAVALSVGGGSQQPVPAGPMGWLPGATLTDEETGQAVRLMDLARGNSGATLLFVLPGCGSCRRVLDELPSLRSSNPDRFIVPVLPGWASVGDEVQGISGLHRDPGSNLATALGMTLAPSALEIDATGRAVGSLHSGGPAVQRLLGAEVQAPAPPEPAPVPEEPTELDYVRRPIPDGVLLDRDGVPRTVRQVAAERAQLLVTVDCLCAPARTAMASVEQWQERLPLLDVKLVLPFVVQPGTLSAAQERMALYDHGGLASRSLGATGQVAAVLLGADGLLAGGPVQGIEEVTAMVDDIAEEIAVASDV